MEYNPDKDWDWGAISCNPNITMEIIEKYPDKNWVWRAISFNRNLTTEIINKYPDKDWDWWRISSNPNITYYKIDKNSPKPIINNIILNKKNQSNLEILKRKEQLLRFRKLIKN